MPFLLLMPSFNQAQYIGAAVRSILAQDDPDWELWIVDNSTDATPSVMAEFHDPRVRFHHIPQRMDPGTCLNWMLERARGRDFSYVHTDNNLAPNYVRAMRGALATEPLALAYCDMRVIDAAGRRIQVSRRGPFDLARLFSLRPLGVPFSATTELARRLGGFSADDIADDVRFCTLAYGLGHYVYLREPLLDYRHHGGSRTETFGGSDQVHMSFLRTHAQVLAELERRGIDPLAAMARAIEERLDDLDLAVEDVWYRYLARSGARWTGGAIDLDAFFTGGLLRLPCQHSRGRNWLVTPRPHRMFRATATSWYHVVRLRLKFRRELKHQGSELRDLLVPWAFLTLGAPADAVRFRVGDGDARTLWGAALLEGNLGWRRVTDGPGASAPALSLRRRPCLGASDPAPQVRRAAPA